MKIQLISDTHGYCPDFNISSEADLIIHAGDISDGYDLYEKTEEFDRLCKQANKDYLFVLGNHDWYHIDINNSPNVYDETKLLSRHKPITINGITFAGCTLWSGLYGVENPNYFAPFVRYLNDFNYIKDATSKDTFFSLERMVEEHKKDLEYIEQYRNKDNVVLITHFPLSQDFLDAKYVGNPLNPYFLNDIDTSGYDIIIAGHTHHTMRKTLDNGSQLFLNAYGYSNSFQKECPSFDTNYSITV